MLSSGVEDQLELVGLEIVGQQRLLKRICLF
jgi:hypothetical protein